MPTDGSWISHTKCFLRLRLVLILCQAMVPNQTATLKSRPDERNVLHVKRLKLQPRYRPHRRMALTAEVGCDITEWLQPRAFEPLGLNDVRCTLYRRRSVARRCWTSMHVGWDLVVYFHANFKFTIRTTVQHSQEPGLQQITSNCVTVVSTWRSICVRWRSCLAARCCGRRCLRTWCCGRRWNIDNTAATNSATTNYQLRVQLSTTATTTNYHYHCQLPLPLPLPTTTTTTNYNYHYQLPLPLSTTTTNYQLPLPTTTTDAVDAYNRHSGGA